MSNECQPIGAIPSCLNHGSGVIRAGESWWRVKKEVMGVGGGSGLVGLHVKVCQPGFLLSQNWPVLTRTVPPGSARTKMSKHKNVEKRCHD